MSEKFYIVIMKFKAILIPLLIMTGCLGFKELPVEYDYSFKGNFKKYRTFDIMDHVGTHDSTGTALIIEKSIIARMKFLGYKRSASKPNLLVGYKLFDDSLNFHGFAQPEIEDWIKLKREDMDYNAQFYSMKSGTLLIQLYDRRQNRSIWQGYATTEYGKIDFGNQRQLRNAVISILDKYRFWADGFALNQNGSSQIE